MKKKLKIILLILFLNMETSFARESLINLSWFDNFNDENLTKCINEALEYNKDVNIAKKNIEKFRQEKNLNISKEFPDVNVGADYLLLKVPKAAIPNNDIQTNSFALPFNLSWEIDYLGKNYNKIQKSKLDIENSYLDLMAADLMVASDVAGAYFNLSFLNSRIKKQEIISNSANEVFKRKKKMFDFGIISLPELNLAEQNYLSEKNNLQELYILRENFLTSLLFYMGKTPSNKNSLEIKEFENIEFTGAYPVDFKGDIINGRPDIMKIENDLKKAKIDITIAKKEFLPKINILGIMVFSTFVQSFAWDGVFAALMAGAVQNIFDGGKRIFTLKKRKIEYEIMAENFLKTDLNAIKEVNDALYKMKTDYQIYENKEKISELAGANFIKVSNSFDKGTKSYIDYLDENMLFLKSDIAYLGSKNQNFINLLTLYKATGGAL